MRIIGHRGASGYRPEHTAQAYRLAFSLGADAVEPDLVASRDGVLVIRHENELSGTTDVAQHPEFETRRTTKTIDGARVSGWFTEDFTWDELCTLRARERRPEIRPENAVFDDRFPLLCLPQLFTLVDELNAEHGGHDGIVAELKHPAYFESIGLPLAELYARDVANAGWSARGDQLATETVDVDVLREVRERGVPGPLVLLFEEDESGDGAGPDAAARQMGLNALRGQVDAISVHKSVLLASGDGTTVSDRSGGTAGIACAAPLVVAAHDAGLQVYCWTLRPENRYLSERYRRGADPARFGAWREEWRQIASLGADAVFADHPDLARSVLR